MSKVTQAAFLITVGLLVVSALFELPIAAGGGAVIMTVALGYALVVTRRDQERAAAEHAA